MINHAWTVVAGGASIERGSTSLFIPSVHEVSLLSDQAKSALGTLYLMSLWYADEDTPPNEERQITYRIRMPNSVAIFESKAKIVFKETIAYRTRIKVERIPLPVGGVYFADVIDTVTDEKISSIPFAVVVGLYGLHIDANGDADLHELPPSRAVLPPAGQMPGPVITDEELAAMQTDNDGDGDEDEEEIDED